MFYESIGCNDPYDTQCIVRNINEKARTWGKGERGRVLLWPQSFFINNKTETTCYTEGQNVLLDIFGALSDETGCPVPTVQSIPAPMRRGYGTGPAIFYNLGDQRHPRVQPGDDGELCKRIRKIFQSDFELWTARC
jgi:hypothetical protein